MEATETFLDLPLPVGACGCAGEQSAWSVLGCFSFFVSFAAVACSLGLLAAGGFLRAVLDFLSLLELPIGTGGVVDIFLRVKLRRCSGRMAILSPLPV